MSSLSYMGSADAQDVLREVSREIAKIEDSSNRTEEQNARHIYLCEVATACECVIGYLNGQYQAHKDAQTPARDSGREVFNTP